jgi:integrase
VLIGAAPWLHVPVGKLREDRYLPLHPNLVALIDDYRTRYVPPDHPLLLPRENGKPVDRHAVTRYLNKAGAAAGLPHLHPHQLRHTLRQAEQAVDVQPSVHAGKDGDVLGRRQGQVALLEGRGLTLGVGDELVGDRHGAASLVP